MATFCLLAFAAFAVIDWMAVARGAKELEYFAKPATLVALLAYAATGDASPWLLAALALSLAGDVFLMLPQDLFLAGLGAFLLAHLAYIRDFQAPVATRLLWLLLPLAASAPVAGRILGAVRQGSLRAAVAFYSLVISFMVASAFASGSVLAATGATLFLVSDTLIAWTRFVRPVAWGEVAIIVTYHLGQLGLASALR